MAKGADTPIRMLLINDDVGEAEAIVSHLRNSGLAVRPTRPANADELSDQLDKHPFDLVLVSSPTTSISDAEAFRLIDGTGKDLPILVEARQFDTDTLLQLSSAGARTIVPRGQLNHLRTIVRREFDDLEARRGLRRLEAQLRETERRCDALIDSSRDPIAYVHEGMYIRANSAYLEMFGYEEFEDIEGMSLLDMVAPAHVADFKQLLKSIGKGDAPPRHELQMRDSNGQDFPAVMEFTPAKYEGEPCLQLVIRRQELDPALAQELEELRTRDQATGLLNRQTFLRELEQRVAEAATGSQEHALLLMELDQLPQIQKQIGFDNVDQLAAAIAERLRRTLGDAMKIARISEHTFAVLLTDSQYRNSHEVGEQVCNAFRSAVLETEDSALSATISVGGTQIGERIAQVSRVLTKANESLQYANGVGGNRVEIFDPRATERAEEERVSAWVEHVREAIDTDQLQLQFQGIANIQNQAENFNEALLRMTANDGSVMLPAQFVPMAEEYGLAGKIDRWVIRHALMAASERQQQTGASQRILTKISQNSLDDPELIADLRRLLEETGMPGTALVLQLSESKVFTNLRAVQQIAHELRDFGVGFCIEQFGTGLNSMQLIGHIKPAFLKINQDLLDDLAESSDSQNRMREIVRDAAAQNSHCIARGVDDATAMTMLFTLGIEYMQGDFVAPVTDRLA
ncbi:MAG: sensor domain-containing phosphodiesterase [Pseudomonadota bacterium]|nr:sensor domain-containing phosphodiesterase [Pseudomonadota bacterium]